MKKVLSIIIVIISAVLLVGGILFWKTYQSFMAVQVIQYDPQLTIFLGGGGNSIALTSEDGKKTLLVDTKMGSASAQIRKRVTSDDIAIVNTHFHVDHISGNKLFPNARIIAGAYSHEQWERAAKKNRYPDTVVKPGEELILSIGNEKVHIRNMGQAHTWDDIVVFLENRRVLISGDMIFINMHPVLFAQSGADTRMWTHALDTLMTTYNVSAIIPGHGPVSDAGAIMKMRDYFSASESAAANPSIQKTLESRFKAYGSIPGMSSLDKTISFIKNQHSSDTN
jgi:glyoxylase-like metal-dependent hydrolase (beta-lactamase superfamily II)